ncbi:MAG: cobalamin biosynthesis protein CobD [Desulfobacteraceae bacterium]|nr:cobalamin biosynthesis protein CobD [Desulfobacteraceae bacterium]
MTELTLNNVLVAVILPAAFILDMAIGDPVQLPHPIRWMGKVIELAEPVFRRLAFSLSVSGGLMAAVLVIITWLTSWIVLKLSYLIHPFFGSGLSAVMLFYAISVRSLADAAASVWQALDFGNLNLAKKRLRYIVGRQVDQLDESGISRATVETVAENLVDGVTAPVFYALLGGPALALAYKMVNTLDSMVGYKNNRYIEFGRWSAKLDDAANYLPARLTVLVIAAGSLMLTHCCKNTFLAARRDGRNHTSPNAGFAEAAFAGTLGITLGGPNTYHGQQVIKPYIGKDLSTCRPQHIPMACDLMILSAIFWISGCWLIKLMFIFRGSWLWI